MIFFPKFSHIKCVYVENVEIILVVPQNTAKFLNNWTVLWEVLQRWLLPIIYVNHREFFHGTISFVECLPTFTLLNSLHLWLLINLCFWVFRSFIFRCLLSHIYFGGATIITRKQQNMAYDFTNIAFRNHIIHFAYIY